MSKQFWYIPVIVLMIVSLACGSSTNNGKKVGEVSQGSSTQTAVSGEAVEKELPTELANEATTPSATPEPAKPTNFNVGDIVETNDLRIVLTSAAYNNGLLKVNFLIENLGEQETNVSSILSFSAKDTEGTVLEQEFMDCGSSLDGKILPGDRMRGDVCWQMASPVKFKVYFDAELFASGAVVWELDANELPQTLAEVEIQPSENQGSNTKTYAVMEPVKSDSQTITLTGAAYNTGKLMANFLIENTGKEEISVSSMISFYVKDSAGVKLEQEYMDCGSSVDGKVLVGDRLRGDICWILPQAGMVKIYYESELFSTGAVVWELDTALLPPTLDRTSIPSAAGQQIQARVYGAGEVAKMDGQTVTLNEVTLSGSVLKANFTVENTGTEEITVSSMISFYARDPEGTALETEYMSCGSQMDGQVLAGDKLKGDVCWKTGGATEATIYYEDEVFGVGAVVWKVK